MGKSINILDEDYLEWIRELSTRYRRSQIKAAVKVNEEMLRFYWELGRDIVEMKAESRWGSGFMKNLSRDLKTANPTATCFSQTNLLYMKNFYCLYSQHIVIHPQAGGELATGFTQQLVEQKVDVGIIPQVGGHITPQVGEQSNHVITPQVGEQIMRDIMSIGWGHHKLLIDKFPKEPQKALFYLHQTVEKGWSRNMLLNFLSTNLYERQGKAITNFQQTLPDETSDLAQELTRDPYDFAFTGITGKYNERLLKDKLLNHITQFLIELGTGFAYVGKEYRLPIGETENFIDLLFYNLRLRCYVVIEVKTAKFSPSDIGQVGTYVVAVDHQLRTEHDNKTIGLLICKEKDRIQAQYALESSSQPIGISEYELEKFYPEKVEGTIPTIEEIEAKLTETLLKEANGNI